MISKPKINGKRAQVIVTTTVYLGFIELIAKALNVLILF